MANLLEMRRVNCVAPGVGLASSSIEVRHTSKRCQYDYGCTRGQTAAVCLVPRSAHFCVLVAQLRSELWRRPGAGWWPRKHEIREPLGPRISEFWCAVQ